MSPQLRGLSQATLVAQTILTSTLCSDDLDKDDTRSSDRTPTTSLLSCERRSLWYTHWFGDAQKGRPRVTPRAGTRAGAGPKGRVHT